MLGEVCREYKGRPDDSEDLPVVGLEHLSQSDIDLLGCSHEETTFTKGFRKGHVLFGRRRAYLKKASLAPFDGVCSGDIIVIEAIADRLCPGLLPFVIQNDYLFDFAVENSAGSLSPRVKWKDLSRFEFDLPCMAKQEELARLLWSAQEVKRVYSRLVSACGEIVKSRFVEMFGKGNWPESSIGDLASDIRYGTSKKAAEEGEYTYLRMNNMTDNGRLDLSDTKRITLIGDELDSCLVRKGDVLFNRTNSREKVGKTAVFDFDEPMVIAGYIIRVRLKPMMRSRYLSVFMNLASTKKLLRDMAKGAVHQANINAKEMAAIELPVPPIELQDEFLSFVVQVDKSEFRCPSGRQPEGQHGIAIT